MRYINLRFTYLLTNEPRKLSQWLCSEEEENFSQTEVRLRESSSSLRHFEPARVKPNKVSIQPKSAGWMAPLTASTFNRLGQCANSPGNRAYCHAELAVSSLVNVVGQVKPKTTAATSRGSLATARLSCSKL